MLHRRVLFSCHSLCCYAFLSAHQRIKRDEWQRRMKRGNDDNINDGNSKAQLCSHKDVCGALNGISMRFQITFWRMKSISYMFQCYCIYAFLHFVTVGQTMLVSTECSMETVVDSRTSVHIKDMHTV